MTPEQILRTYADLAELYERQGQPKHRDWFLVLAADAALSAGQPAEADRLLGRLLELNPHHFLRPFASFGEALRSPDVQGYVGNLKRNYPPEKAHGLLEAEQRKRGAEDHDEPSPKPARPVAPPPMAPPPREPSEVLFARVRTAPQEEAEAHFAPAPEPPPKPEPKPRPTPQPRAPLPKPKPILRPARDEVPPEEDELTLEDTPPPPKPKPAAESKPRRGARRAARGEPPPEVSSFLPSLLFVVLLLATFALVAYALFGPLLPEWTP